MKKFRSMNLSTSSIKMIGALHAMTMFHSGTPSGTMPKMVCRIGVYNRMKWRIMESVMAYTKIMLFHSGRVSRDSDDDRAFMALSISMTTRIDSDTVDAVRADSFEKISQPI